MSKAKSQQPHTHQKRQDHFDKNDLPLLTAIQEVIRAHESSRHTPIEMEEQRQSAARELVPMCRELANVTQKNGITQWGETLATKILKKSLPLCAHEGIKDAGVKTDGPENTYYVAYGAIDISGSDDNTQIWDDIHQSIEEVVTPLTIYNLGRACTQPPEGASNKLLAIADRIEKRVLNVEADRAGSLEQTEGSLTGGDSGEDDAAGPGVSTVQIKTETTGAGETIAPAGGGGLCPQGISNPLKGLPALGKHDKQAYQLYNMHLLIYENQMTQQQVADRLNKEHSTNYTQGQVSKMIARVKRHAVASGITELIPEPIEPESYVDPKVLDMGCRTDHLTQRQRHKRIEDDE